MAGASQRPDARHPVAPDARAGEELLPSSDVSALWLVEFAVAAAIIAMLFVPTAGRTGGTDGRPISGTLEELGPSHAAQGLADTGPTDRSTCPPLFTCTTTGRVPPSVRASIRAAFPRAVIGWSREVHINGDAAKRRLWFRVVNARVGGTPFQLIVQSAHVGDGAESGWDGRSTYCERQYGIYDVRAQVQAGGIRAFTAVRRVCADSGVLADR